MEGDRGIKQGRGRKRGRQSNRKESVVVRGDKEKKIDSPKSLS